MAKKINLGLIGAGRIAGHHIRAIKKDKNFKILSICDLNTHKAQNYAVKNNLKYYSHYKEMLSKEKTLDAVAILTPSGMHYSHSIDILKKFKKHIIVEKPTALKTSEIINLYKAARKVKKKYFLFFKIDTINVSQN